MAIAGTSCGADDSSDTPTVSGEKSSLSKSELIEQGDAICAEQNAAIGALGLKAEKAEVPDVVEESTDLFIEMIERLQSLGKPAEDDGGYSKFAQATEHFATVEAKVKLASEKEDFRALSEAATEAAPTLEEFRTQAEMYGFKECSEDAVASSAAGG